MDHPSRDRSMWPGSTESGEGCGPRLWASRVAPARPGERLSDRMPGAKVAAANAAERAPWVFAIVLAISIAAVLAAYFATRG